MITQKKKTTIAKKNFLIGAILIILLFLSRILFLSNSCDFFDATQYVRRVTEPFLASLTSGHPPFHPLFIAFGNIFYNITSLFGADTAKIAATLPSVIFGSLAVIVFYFLVREILGRKIALLTSVFIAIVPFFWISNITILVDPTGIFFVILAAYLYWKGLSVLHSRCVKCVKNKIIFYIFFAGISYGLAIFAHTSFGIWAPIFLGLLIYKWLEKGFNWKDILYSLLFFIGPILAVFSYIYLLNLSGLFIGKRTALEYLLLGNIGDKMPYGIRYTLRNLWYESGSAIMILSLLGLITMLAKKWKLAILMLIWIAPVFIVSSYIYENLHGRAMMLAIFALCILSAYFIFQIKKTWLRIVLIIIVLAMTLNISLSAVYSYAAKITANETLSEFEEKLPNNSLVIGTNTMRTWSNDSAIEKYERMGDVDVGTTLVRQDMADFGAQGKPVYLTSDAIVYPYWRYDGEFFDLRTIYLWNKEKNAPAVSLGSELFEDNSYDLEMSDLRFKKYVLKRTNEQDLTKRIEYSLDHLPKNQNLVLGRLADSENGVSIGREIVYLNDDDFYMARENILERDFGYQLYRFIRTEFDPLLWTISDQGGIFILPTSDNIGDINLDFISDPYTSRDKNGKSFFLEKKIINTSNLNLNKKENLNQIQLLEEIKKLPENKSFFLKKYKNSDKFDLIIFDYDAPKTKRIETEDLASRTGKISDDNNASSEKIRTTKIGKDAGIVTAGPFITLEPGKYRLIAKLKIDNSNSDMNDFGKIEVAGGFDNMSFAEKQFSKEDLENFKDYNIVTVDFELKKETPNIEFRTFATGHANLYIDYFELEKIN